jgi:hypothetical protein
MTQRIIGDSEFVGYLLDQGYDDGPRREPDRWHVAPVYLDKPAGECTDEEWNNPIPVGYLAGWERAYAYGPGDRYVWEFEFKTLRELAEWAAKNVTAPQNFRGLFL